MSFFLTFLSLLTVLKESSKRKKIEENNVDDDFVNLVVSFLYTYRYDFNNFDLVYLNF